MNTTQAKAVGWTLTLVGVLVFVFRERIVFPGLERVIGIETIVGKQNVVYLADGGYVFTNPGAMVRWVSSVAAVGVLICLSGIWLVFRTRKHDESSLNGRVRGVMNATGPFLSVPEAQRLIHDPEITHGRRKVIAAATLMEYCEHDLQITIDDMLRCLDYGGTIATMGARCLYVRTGRDGLGWKSAGTNGMPYVVDRTDWEAYLREHNPTGGA